MKKFPVKLLFTVCFLFFLVASLAHLATRRRLPLLVGATRVCNFSEVSFSMLSKDYSLVLPETMSFFCDSIRTGNITESYNVSSKIDSGLWGKAIFKYADGKTEDYSAIVSRFGLVLYLPGVYEIIDDPQVVEVFFSEPLPQEVYDFLLNAHRDRDVILGPIPKGRDHYSSEDIETK